MDPWAAARIAPSRSTEDAVTAWVEELAEWPPTSSGTALEIDPGPWASQQPRILLDSSRVDQLVSSGDRAAFHATFRGRYHGGLPDTRADGRSVEGHLGAFAEVREGELVSLRGTTNRVALARQLRRPARG